MIINIIRWIAVLAIAFVAGKLMTKIKMPSILGWLIVGMILGAGIYTFIYIAARAFGKYFGARAGAKFTHMPDTVKNYLGLTLLPHSGVSLVFTGIICSTLASAPEYVNIVQGTIAAAAVINEFIAVFAAKKGFELAREIKHTQKTS